MGVAAELRPAAGRVPPCDLDAEGAVLSAVMLDVAALYEVQGLLRTEDFYSDANRRVFEAVQAIEASGATPDVVTVAGHLRTQGQLERVGGVPYLAQLTDATPAIGHVADHARIVAAKSHARRLIATCQAIAAEGYGDVGDPVEWGQRVEQRVYEAARWDRGGPTDGTLETLVPQAIEDITARARGEDEGHIIPTGFPYLDRAIGGWRPKPYVIGGRPGMGKSAFAQQCALQVAAQGWAGVVVSLEMDESEMTLRAIANAADVDYRKLEDCKLDDHEWARALLHAERLRKLPVSFRKVPGASVAQIRSTVRREFATLQRRHGENLRLGMVVVDYIQNIRGVRQRGESRENELTQICRELMWMSGELGCAVLECSQLNRSLESRPNKRPNLSDLRESGAIEQDAFAVLFPFRSAYYDQERSKDPVQECEVIIAKHRNGPAPSVRFDFFAPSIRFDTPKQWDSLTPEQCDSFYDIAEN